MDEYDYGEQLIGHSAFMADLLTRPLPALLHGNSIRSKPKSVCAPRTSLGKDIEKLKLALNGGFDSSLTKHDDSAAEISQAHPVAVANDLPEPPIFLLNESAPKTVSLQRSGSSLRLEAEIHRLQDECVEQTAALSGAHRDLHMYQSLASRSENAEFECAELRSMLADAETSSQRQYQREVQDLQQRLHSFELEASQQESCLREAHRDAKRFHGMEQETWRLRGQVEALQAECSEREADVIETRSKEQRYLRLSEDNNDKLNQLQSVKQQLQTELNASRQEVKALTLDRQQFQSQLEAAETARAASERQLQSTQARVNDLSCQNDSAQRELRQMRFYAEESQELSEERQRLGAELSHTQGEVSDLRNLLQQDRLWAAQLKQKNLRLAQDARASGEYAESLQAELLGTGERVTDRHAQCCELWVALENERLETQRLRDVIDAAKRDNLTLTQRLQQTQNFRSSSGVPPLSGGEAAWETRQHAATSSTNHLTVPPPSSPKAVAAGPPFAQRGGAAGPPMSASTGGKRIAFAAADSHPEAGISKTILDTTSRGGNLDLRSRRSSSAERPGFRLDGVNNVFAATSGSNNPGDLTDRRRHEPLGSSRDRFDFLNAADNLSNSAAAPSAARRLGFASRDNEQSKERPVEGPRERQEGDTVSRIMRQGHYPQEAEAQRDKQVSAIEKQLMVLNGERHLLEGTLMKFPSNASGKTLAERRQKKEAEERLEEINKTLSELRQQLRRAQG